MTDWSQQFSFSSVQTVPGRKRKKHLIVTSFLSLTFLGVFCLRIKKFDCGTKLLFCALKHKQANTGCAHQMLDTALSEREYGVFSFHIFSFQPRWKVFTYCSDRTRPETPPFQQHSQSTASCFHVPPLLWLSVELLSFVTRSSHAWIKKPQMCWN